VKDGGGGMEEWEVEEWEVEEWKVEEWEVEEWEVEEWEVEERWRGVEDGGGGWRSGRWRRDGGG